MENDVYITVFLTLSTLVYSYTSIALSTCSAKLYYTTHCMKTTSHSLLDNMRESGERERQVTANVNNM